MDALSRRLLLPIMLLLDGWMFQYLVFVYFPKRQHPRVSLLLLASFLGLATHVYFHESDEVMAALTSISDTSLLLTFLIQITIIGRAVGKKVKLRAVARFTSTAEVLILLGWLHVFVSLLELAGISVSSHASAIGDVLELVSLLFVTAFRFFYLSLSGGFERVLAERKPELVLYLVLTFHEVPFLVLERQTGVKCEFIQGTLNRVIVMACILLNIHQKVRQSSRGSYSTTGKRDSIVHGRGSVASSRGSVVKITTGRLSVDIPTSMVASSASRRGSNPAHQGYPDITKIAVTTGPQHIDSSAVIVE